METQTHSQTSLHVSVHVHTNTAACSGVLIIWVLHRLCDASRGLFKWSDEMMNTDQEEGSGEPQQWRDCNNVSAYAQPGTSRVCVFAPHMFKVRLNRL